MAARVSYVTRAGVGHIRLARPDKRNALDQAMVETLIDTMERFDRDPDVRSGVLSAEGPAFCAGGDLQMFPEIDSVRGLDSVRDGERVGRVFQTTRKPIVAAVHGACIAGGFEIVLGAHFVYAAQGARFGMEEIRLGLIPGWGGTVRLPRAIPVRMATELLLTGRQIDAQEAFRLGIVNHVAEDAEQCLAAATRTAELIAEMPARAIGFAMDVIRASRDDSDSAFSVEQAATAMLFGTEEAHQRIDNVLRRGIGR